MLVGNDIDKALSCGIIPALRPQLTGRPNLPGTIDSVSVEPSFISCEFRNYAPFVIIIMYHLLFLDSWQYGIKCGSDRLWHFYSLCTVYELSYWQYGV